MGEMEPNNIGHSLLYFLKVEADRIPDFAETVKLSICVVSARNSHPGDIESRFVETL